MRICGQEILDKIGTRNNFTYDYRNKQLVFGITSFIAIFRVEKFVDILPKLQSSTTDCRFLEWSPLVKCDNVWSVFSRLHLKIS